MNGGLLPVTTEISKGECSQTSIMIE